MLIAKNKGITIEIAKYREKDVVVDLYYKAKKKNKKELVEEINTALTMSGMREISLDELDESENYLMTMEETEAIDSGKPIKKETKEPIFIEDIAIVKYEGGISENGDYFRILIDRKN